jgi:hypothetical protein
MDWYQGEYRTRQREQARDFGDFHRPPPGLRSVLRPYESAEPDSEDGAKSPTRHPQQIRKAYPDWIS